MHKRKAPSAPPRTKKSRTRSGCFTCRDRHMKCDEQMPVCQNCINGKRKCYRGVRLNFTSYTLYDPQEDSGAPPFPLTPPFRILDQSIAVLALYENGDSRYRPYLGLHEPRDLADAEQYLRQELGAPRPPAPSVARTPSFSPANVGALLTHDWGAQSMFLSLSDNVILENYDIKNFLMNPPLVLPLSLPHDLQADQNPLPPTFFSDSALASDTIDADAVVSVLQTQNYCWLLDLFNDLSLWKSVVPHYCIRAVQRATDQNPGFLLDCLLGCKEHTSDRRILHNARQQLEHWYPFEVTEVSPASFAAFERLLLSIVLVTLSVLLRATKPSFKFTTQFQMVLANQGLLLHKVAALYCRIPPSTMKRLPSMLLTIASFQAMVVLRLFMKKHIRASAPDYSFPAFDSSLDPLKMRISLEPQHFPSLGYFFTPTPFEIAHLNDDFRDFDLPCESPDHVSDSSKLRRVVWSLARLELSLEGYIMNVNEHFSPLHREEEHFAGSTLIPSEQCIAIHILSKQVEKLSPGSDLSRHSSNIILHEIFDKINSSAMSPDAKAKWQAHFGWNLDYDL